MRGMVKFVFKSFGTENQLATETDAQKKTNMIQKCIFIMTETT